MNAHKMCLFALFILSVCGFVTSAVVYTENGAVSGTTFTTFGGRVVDAFLGIPYAKPPVKENRFRDPQPPEKWRGVRSAQAYGDKCMQVRYYQDQPGVQGSEDCLTLNIYTPNSSNSSKLNVIVFIHGGCFMLGKGSIYTPYYILDNRDLVFVTLNYRLGPLGFLSTEDHVIPGNFGLKDQTMALKWIRNNIENFGGDRDKITVTGNSAGGVSVHLHYMSPLSRDLFKNGISESGTALDPWALVESPLQKAKMLAAAAGCPTTSSKEILDCLQSIDAANFLINVQQLFQPWVNNPFTPFGPVVEPKSENAFLSEHPYKIIKEGRVKDVPWMTYITSEEGLYPATTFLANDSLMQELDENWDMIAPHLLDYNFTVPEDRLIEVSKKIRHYYLGDSKIDNESRDGLVKLMSDRIFGAGAEKTVRLQASVSKSPVYFFVFGYRSGVSVTKAFCHCDEYFGVSHTDSTTYLMNTGLAKTNYSSVEDRKTVEAMVNIWFSFANSSVPFAGKNFFIPPVSPDIGEEGNLTFFLLTSSHDIKNTVDLTNRKFWDSLGLMENENALLLNEDGSERIVMNTGVISTRISNNLMFFITIKYLFINMPLLLFKY